MKYDKKEPETMDADPMRLLVTSSSYVTGIGHHFQ